MKIAKNCTKMAILEANFMIDLIGQIRIQFLDSMELKYLLDSKLDSNLPRFEPYPYLGVPYKKINSSFAQSG